MSNNDINGCIEFSPVKDKVIYDNDDGYAKIKIRYGDGVLLSQLYGVYPYN